jgi:hypothetical protein
MIRVAHCIFFFFMYKFTRSTIKQYMYQLFSKKINKKNKNKNHLQYDMYTVENEIQLLLYRPSYTLYHLSTTTLL